jgi:hypothetical protein
MTVKQSNVTASVISLSTKNLHIKSMRCQASSLEEFATLLGITLSHASHLIKSLNLKPFTKPRCSSARKTPIFKANNKYSTQLKERLWKLMSL